MTASMIQVTVSTAMRMMLKHPPLGNLSLHLQQEEVSHYPIAGDQKLI
jgi:hypothetical protein